MHGNAKPSRGERIVDAIAQKIETARIADMRTEKGNDNAV